MFVELLRLVYDVVLSCLTPQVVAHTDQSPADISLGKRLLWLHNNCVRLLHCLRQHASPALSGAKVGRQEIGPAVVEMQTDGTECVCSVFRSNSVAPTTADNCRSRQRHAGVQQLGLDWPGRRAVRRRVEFRFGIFARITSSQRRQKWKPT